VREKKNYNWNTNLKAKADATKKISSRRISTQSIMRDKK